MSCSDGQLERYQLEEDKTPGSFNFVSITEQLLSRRIYDIPGFSKWIWTPENIICKFAIIHNFFFLLIQNSLENFEIR